MAPVLVALMVPSPEGPTGWVEAAGRTWTVGCRGRGWRIRCRATHGTESMGLRVLGLGDDGLVARATRPSALGARVVVLPADAFEDLDVFRTGPWTTDPQEDLAFEPFLFEWPPTASDDDVICLCPVPAISPSM